MRLLEVRTRGAEPLVVRPHARLAVVEADAEVRVRLLAALAVALRGGSSEVGGVIEAAGVVLDLSPDVAQTIGMPGADGQTSTLDVLLAEHLPGARLGTALRHRREAAELVATRRDRAIAARATAARATVAVHELEQLLASAVADLTAVRSSAVTHAGVRAALERAFLAEEYAAGVLGTARARRRAAQERLDALHPAVSAALADLRARVAGLDRLLLEEHTLRAAVASDPRPAPGGHPDPAASRAPTSSFLPPPQPFGGGIRSAAVGSAAPAPAPTVRQPSAPGVGAWSAPVDGDAAEARRAEALRHRDAVAADVDRSGALLGDVRHRRSAAAAALAAAQGACDAVDERRAVQAALQQELAAVERDNVAEVAGALATYVELLAKTPAQGLGEALAAWRGQAALVERMRGERPATEPVTLALARQRVAAANDAVLQAERGQAPVLDPIVRRRIEEAHEAVLAAEEKAERRFAGAGVKQRLTEAREHERVLLAEFGLPSFSAYLLSTTIGGQDPSAEQRLESARRELAAAEHELALLEGGTGADRALRQAEADLEELREQVRRLAGMEPELVVFEQRAHDELADARVVLEAALLRTGVVPGAAPVEEVAAAWMAGHRGTDARRAELTAELARVSADLLALEGGLASAMAEVGPLSDEVARLEAEEQRLAEEHARLQEALLRAEAEVGHAHAAAEEARAGSAVAADAGTPPVALAPPTPLPKPTGAVPPPPGSVPSVEPAAPAAPAMAAPAMAAPAMAAPAMAAPPASPAPAASPVRPDGLLPVAADGLWERLARIEQVVRAARALVEEARTVHEAMAAELEAAGREVAEAAAAVAAAEEEAEAAAAERARLEQLQDAEMPALGEDELQVRIADLEGEVAVGREAEAAARAEELAAVEALVAAERQLAEAGAALQDHGGASDVPVHEVEFFLLSRVLAQRAMSITGATPLVVDDALAALPERERLRLLTRLAHLAEDVQVLYLTDDPAVLAWADQLSADLGARCRPMAPV